MSNNRLENNDVNNFTIEVKNNTIETINNALDHHFHAIKKYKSNINNVKYQKYIQCIRNSSIKKMIYLAKMVHDFGIVRQYDWSDWNSVAFFVSFLEEQYEVIDFYNYHRDNVFIMNNLEHLPEILNFN